MAGKIFRSTLVAVMLCTAAMSQQKKIVDFEADVMRPVKMGDSSALSLVGNVVFYHNGAVITCDSAIRYNDRMMDCYRNVIINKDKTYIYGDKADYNGYINTAKVYSPIVKVVDEDATLYTYNFSYNTQESIGSFSGGGTMTQKDNKLESRKGYYYTDTRTLICVNEVEMENPDYKLRSDSVSYDLNNETAKFFVQTYIWNKDLDILSAIHGNYDRRNEIFDFTKDSYILTKDKEMWADSIKYFKNIEEAVLQRNIQIRDEVQKVMSFGDYGRYWGKKHDERVLMTKRPSMVTFNPGEDSLYMRSDTMYMYTVRTFENDSLMQRAMDSIPSLMNQPAPGTSPAAVADSIPQPDSTQLKNAADSLSVKPLSKKELKRRAAQLKKEKKAALRAAKQAARRARQAERSARLREKYGLAIDSTEIKKRIADSLQMLEAARLSIDSLPQEPVKRDSISRILQAYHNVKMFRNDFQAVCDSLVGFSVDSTIHMYIDPVLWSQENQIKSEVVDMYMKNGQLEKAIFTGDPIMSSQIDTVHYNQVKGKTIEAFFRDNEIYRTDVNGNAQTYYYMQEDNPDTVFLQGFLVAECANITFNIENRQVTQIIYRGQPVYTIYPMSKIPDTQSLYLKGFVWEGDRRPGLEEVFDRIIRPSQRREYEAIPTPGFDITKAIDTHKQYLIISGQWRDRNDKLSQEAIDFIRSLGHTLKQ